MKRLELLGSLCCAQLVMALVMALPGRAQAAPAGQAATGGTGSAATAGTAAAPKVAGQPQSAGQPQGPVAAKLSLRAEHPLVVRGGQGSTVFEVVNETDAAVTGALTPGPVSDAGSYAALNGAKTVLGQPAATAPAANAAVSPAPLPVSVPPHQEISVQANVTGVTGASAAVLPIYNGSVRVGEIPLFVQDAPLNISVDGAGSSATPLGYGYAEPVWVTLKNNDADAYLVHWMFQIGGRKVSEGNVNLPANGSTPIRLKDTCEHQRPRPEGCTVYGWFDWVHPTALTGTLVIKEASQGAANLDGLLPGRSVPVSLKMNRLSEAGTELWTYTWVVVFLTMGGFLSYLASSVLPNAQRKADLRAQLHDLANRTSTVSTRVDSYVRVLLRLERSRIADGLDSASPWIPASTDPFAQIPAAIDTLNKRLTAAERLDELSRKHDRISMIAPPSVTDTIDLILQAAGEQLHSAALSDSELQAADAALNKAQAALDMLDDSDALAKLIAGNLAALQTRVEKFPVGYYEDLKQALPGIFVILDDKYKDPKNIVRPMLFAIDHAVAAMHLVLDYAMVRASIPTLEGVAAAAAAGGDGGAGATPGPNAVPLSASHCAGLGDAARDRLAKRQCVLIELLGKLSWQGLRDANLLVQQMRQDIYEEDVIAEMANPGQAEITTDTQKTRPYLPVFFKVTFQEPRFNSAAALERMICHWKFPDHLEEHCWGVCHYFTGREKDCGPEPAGEAAAAQQSDPAGGHGDKGAAEETAAKAGGQRESALERVLARRQRRRNQHAIKKLWVSATIRGQNSLEAREVPIPPLTATVKLQPPPRAERSRAGAELIRFLIAMGVAIAGLLSGALDQLSKLEFLPATIAILGLGFSANSVKNLLTQSTTPVTLPKVTSR